jgi:hypothetical protein
MAALYQKQCKEKSHALEKGAQIYAKAQCPGRHLLHVMFKDSTDRQLEQSRHFESQRQAWIIPVSLGGVPGLPSGAWFPGPAGLLPSRPAGPGSRGLVLDRVLV